LGKIRGEGALITKKRRTLIITGRKLRARYCPKGNTERVFFRLKEGVFEGKEGGPIPQTARKVKVERRGGGNHLTKGGLQLVRGENCFTVAGKWPVL